MYSRFPQLLEEPKMKSRLQQAKIQAAEIMTGILIGSDVIVSTNGNRIRRQTEDYFENLQFVIENVTSITAVNYPFDTDTFLVTFK